MKYILSILLLTFSLASCKKDYQCTCSKVYNNSIGNNTRDFSVKTIRDNEKNADAKCKNDNSSGSDSLGNYNIACVIDC
ncbi:MAG: hypothetical protein K0S26_1372 [Bacteroidota bacterium]|nr:hypothetical protein [Bacteroidota bacterium]